MPKIVKLTDKQKLSSKEAVRKAAKIFKMKTGRDLYEALCVTPPHIHAISSKTTRCKDRVISPDLCPNIEYLTEGAVTAEELRPDVPWWIIRGSNDPIASLGKIQIETRVAPTEEQFEELKGIVREALGLKVEK